MKRKTASVLLGLPVAFLLGSLVRPDAVRPVAGHPPLDLSPVVAVVDVRRVSKAYPRARKLNEAAKAEEDQVQLALRKAQEEIDKLALELRGWEPFTPQWIAAREKAASAKAALESRGEMEQRRLLLERFRNRELIYADIDRAVQELAKKQKLQLVLKMLPESNDDPLDQRVGTWPARAIFYYDEKLDLTEDVIKSLQSPAFAGGGAANGQNDKDSK
jgi:Skp family chaperone for outer membrane proteins